MGEYARIRGTRTEVKIGTCENLYYLRADQADQVAAVSGSVDPVKDRFELRFRFPFPDEDHIAPGGFGDYLRGVKVWGWSTPADWADGHSTVQLRGSNGYLLNVPCPEAAPKVERGHRIGTTNAGEPLVVMLGQRRADALNGYGGSAELVQQKHVQGEGLAGVVRCKGCGALWRLPYGEAVKIAEEWVRTAERQQVEHERAMRRDGRAERELGVDEQATFLLEMARRLVRGYSAHVVPA